MCDVLLEVQDLKKFFKTSKGMLHAVDGVSFTIERQNSWDCWRVRLWQNDNW